MSLVFQYGSNAMVPRLNGPKRLRGHAQDLGRACTVDDYDIAFDVYSQTNGCAASDLITADDQKAWGVLYDIPDEFIRGNRKDKQKTLADIEGPRYEETTIRVRDHEGNEQEVITFVVKENERQRDLATSAAYVSWIVYGLRAHAVPEEYIDHVVQVAVETNKRAGEAAAEQTRLINTL